MSLIRAILPKKREKNALSRKAHASLVAIFYIQ